MYPRPRKKMSLYVPLYASSSVVSPVEYRPKDKWRWEGTLFEVEESANHNTDMIAPLR